MKYSQLHQKLAAGDLIERLARLTKQRMESVEATMIEWRSKRERYALQMEDDFSWRGVTRDAYGGSSQKQRRTTSSWLHREEGEGEDVFEISNESVNIVGGFAEFMTARTVDDVFGTMPFFAAAPEGLSDKILSESIQKYIDWKLRLAKWHRGMVEAIRSSYFLGEGIVKQSWCREADVYDALETVMVGPDGSPVTTTAGEYIYENDPITIDELAGVVFPAKDPATDLSSMPQPFTFAEVQVEKTLIRKNNVDCAVMDHQNFLCPTTAKSLEDSDFVAHTYAWHLSKIVDFYGLDATAREALRAAASDKSGKPAPSDTRGEREEAQNDDQDPLISLAECYCRADVMDDMKMRRVQIVLCPSIEMILSVDYIANVTPDGRLPFTVIRSNPVKNRWYGRGFLETLEPAQTFIDRTFNQVIVRNDLSANPAGGYDESALADAGEAMEGDTYQLRPGKYEKLARGKKMSDFLSHVVVPDMDERTWQLMQFVIQVIQVRTGVTSAAQGEVSAMPSTATATGIESILQSASTLAKLPMLFLRDDLESALHYATELIFANFDGDEVFTYFEGDEAAVGALTAEQSRDISVNVRMLMTRLRQREMREASQMAIKDLMAYLQFPEEEKTNARQLFVQSIKGLGIDNADQIVRMPMIQQQPAGLVGPDGAPVAGEQAGMVPFDPLAA